MEYVENAQEIEESEHRVGETNSGVTEGTRFKSGGTRTETIGPTRQEFVLRWSPDGGNSFKEIVHQQWNFSPPETTREVEEYQVELSNVTVLEMVIKPNIGGELAPASLKNLRLS